MFGWSDSGVSSFAVGDTAFTGGSSPDGLRRLRGRALYRSHPWVNVGVNLLARGVAKTPLKSYRDEDGSSRTSERLHYSSHGLPRVIRRPVRRMSTNRWLGLMMVEAVIEGVALAWIDRPGPGGEPDQLVPMRAEQLRVQRRTDGRIGFYEWREHPTSEPHRILPDDVLRLGFADGVSPLEPLARALEIDEAAQRSMSSFYRHGVRPGGILTTERPMQPEAVERIEDMLRGDHAGASNHFRTVILGNMPGAKWLTADATSKDMETVDHRKLAREEVLAVLHIPQPIGGVLDRATFSNIETQTRMWVIDSLGEWFSMIESEITSQLIDSTLGWDDCYVEFDPSAILRGAPLDRAQAYNQWLYSGTRTPNELRGLENLPPIDDAWANAIYVPANLVPAGLPGGMSGTPPTSAVRPASRPAENPAPSPAKVIDE